MQELIQPTLRMQQTIKELGFIPDKVLLDSSYIPAQIHLVLPLSLDQKGTTEVSSLTFEITFGLLDMVLYKGKAQQLANTECGQAQAQIGAFAWAQQFEILPGLLLQIWRGKEFPFLLCAPLFCGTKQPNQFLLFFSNS